MTIFKNSHYMNHDLKIYIGDNYHSFFNRNHKIRRINFSGLVFGMFWLAYRKKYLLVSIFVLIDISISFLFRNHLFFWLFFALLMHLYIGKSANLLYLAGTKKHIERIRKKYSHLDETGIEDLLIQKGRTSWKLILPLLIYFVVFHTFIFMDDLKDVIELIRLK